MSKLKNLVLFVSALILINISGCDNELKVNAPKKDVIVVYGVLNPKEITQYIRVSKAFLTESDALQYASENDLSLKDARVTLSFLDNSGNNREVVLAPIDTVRKKGTFNEKITLYTTREAIIPGRKYEIKVQLTGDEKPIVSAYTYVPDDMVPIRPSEIPLINNPDAPDSQGFQEAYPLLMTDTDNFSVSFLKSNRSSQKHPGLGFETRVYVDYSEKGSSEVKRLQFGPSGVLDKSTGNCLGLSGDPVMCVKLGKSLRDFLQNNLDQNKSYTVNASFLSEACKLEYTAVDTFLFNFMKVNNPGFIDFTTVKPEYTNVKGGLGIFGSVNSTIVRVRLTPCTKYLAKINDTPQPDGCR